MAGAWRAAGWLAICLLRPGLGLAGATQHTLTKLTLPLTSNEVNRVLSKPTPPSSLIAATEVLFEHTHITPPHTADCTAVFSCCLAGDK